MYYSRDAPSLIQSTTIPSTWGFFYLKSMETNEESCSKDFDLVVHVKNFFYYAGYDYIGYFIFLKLWKILPKIMFQLKVMNLFWLNFMNLC